MKSLRSWIILLINSLVFLVVVTLSIFSYKEFKNALDERVLLQLSSIKKLKRIQLEAFLQAEMDEFKKQLSQGSADSISNPYSLIAEEVDIQCLQDKLNLIPNGESFFDITSCARRGVVKLAMIKKEGNKIQQIQCINSDAIQEILMERTGMGESGETYLVGRDFRMRSLSRFMPDTPPGQIKASTLGAKHALQGINGFGIIDDYRGISVYSSYHKLDIANLDWAILSEIDVKEVTAPLLIMRNKLFLISFLVLLFALTFSFLITVVLSKPLLKMRLFLNFMTRGNYDFNIENDYQTKEIKEMFVALKKLQKSIREAIYFSAEIGNMNMKAKYELSGEGDVLGKSLMVMQKKLMEYENAEKISRLMAKKSLIEGQENERKRLSKDLHDGVGPLLTSLKLMVQTSELSSCDKKKINTVVDGTIDEIRRMTYNLMPSVLVDFGVGRALASFIERMKKSSGIEIVYDDATKGRAGRLSMDLDICIFRVSQELINNTLKHAHAKKITISLTEFNDKISLYYLDDGKGFDPKTIKYGAGLRNIRERVEIFNGYLSISSDHNGTEVEVEIPLKDE
ncbi:sensor histidine kinase [Cyclobacterium marinum]|uniref:histidine kinase n=1 Tax=Cyclobacterium marinum (strain ATCC 25205 / DSM 745 / LMG 13164 / NCIMB 1802) TaxID=880070 RepID=G0IVA2_CYCMS|nr:ATP-binding protein [Cyclobacterium marinum]AEL27901.1 integral membrane sensor signal transduction histidine kinase [Cyclobacterium marinum DSM 745]MBI0397675.1 sensor histidine kinase [Cyclobacterium marinum]